MFAYTAVLAVMTTVMLMFTPPVPSVMPSVVSAPSEWVTERVLGYSESGREILGYEIGSGAECLLFFGGIHGNEQGTVELLQRFIDELENRPTLLSSGKRLLVIPLVNPDGYSDRTDKLNAHGVNLNRNFATDGWVVQEGDAETYAGQEPFSEVEARVLRDAVNTCDPQLMIAFHSQGALVSPEFNPASIDFAQWYAAHSGYEYFDEWDYAGTATRWFVETTGRAAITVELSTHVDSDWSLNKRPLLEIIAR